MWIEDLEHYCCGNKILIIHINRLTFSFIRKIMPNIKKQSNDNYYDSSVWYDRLLTPFFIHIGQTLVDMITI